MPGAGAIGGAAIKRHPDQRHIQQRDIIHSWQPEEILAAGKARHQGGVISSPVLALQDSIQRTITAAPDAFVDLRLGTPPELEQWVAEGNRDVVIGPFAKHGPGVVYVALYREVQALYCGAGHRLFDMTKPEVSDIESSMFSVRGYRQLEDLYRVNHPRASANVIHMEAQAMLILSGKYIGFLPRHMGDAFAARGERPSF